MRVFVAGATGAIGRRLIPQLVAGGHHVVASTRSPAKFDLLWNLGAEPVELDGLDAAAVGSVVARARPDAVVHQMTALQDFGNPRHFDRVFATTNRLRTEGTDNLLAAAQATGVRRVVVQSFTGWPNERTGGPVKTEDDPLDPTPPRQQRATLAAIQHLEQAVLNSSLEAVALRYGMFYGPGASDDLLEQLRRRRMPIAGDGTAIWSLVHVDDAAAATVAALERGRGIYNIVDDDPAPVRDVLTTVAGIVGAPPPRRVPVWLARLAAGEVGVAMLTESRGSSNAKARRELDWAPRWPSWRDGFRLGPGTVAAAAAGERHGG